MANYPSKTNLPIAASNHSKLNLSGQHATTTNFMEYGIAKYLHVVPGQTIPTTHTALALFDAIPTPVMGRASLHHKCFFVPYRTIFPGWDDMNNDTIHYYPDGTSGHVTVFPYFNDKTARDFFLSPSNSELVTDDDVLDENCDIVAIIEGPTPEIRRYNLKPRGRRAMKFFTSLGYRINFNELASDTNHNALAFLAAIKVYMDFYYPSAYVQDERAASVYAYTTRDVNDDFMEIFPTPNDFDDIFDVVGKVNYDNDFYGNLWDNPAGPNSGGYTDIIVGDITNDGSTSRPANVSTDSDNGTPTVSLANGSGISHYLLTALRSVSDYFKRNSMVGSRALDRFLARWGVSLSSEKLKRSIMIDDYVQEVKFGEIFSTADTTGANLGRRAGRGSTVDKIFYDYNSNDHGIVLWITTVIPHHGYVQGEDKMNLAMTKLDLLTPEFDALGVEAVSPRELFMPLNSKLQYPEEKRNTNNFGELDFNENVFGFASRYYAHKIGRDCLSGDFMLGSKNGGLQGYTFFRNMEPIFSKYGMNTRHDASFVEGSDSIQYNRIFYYRGNESTNDYDHIKLFHNFEIKSVSPCKSLYDNYDFENEDAAKHLSIDVNGVKAN